MNNVRIYTSSERRVTASAEIFAAALLTPSSAQQANGQAQAQNQQQQQPVTVTSPIAISPSNSLPPHAHKDHTLIGSLQSFANAVVHQLPHSHVSTHNSSLSVDNYSPSPTAATFSTSLSIIDPSSNSPRLSTNSSLSATSRNDKDKSSTALQLIIRKDLLDDSNEAKDLMDEVKKRLKILLRPGEPERRPQLTWPKHFKEPVEVVAVRHVSSSSLGLLADEILQEVIELLSGFRQVMRHSFETMDTDKFQQRWCCGDEPWLFRERWEKLFEDFCDVKQEKFDPSRVCRYST